MYHSHVPKATFLTIAISFLALSGCNPQPPKFIEGIVISKDQSLIPVIFPGMIKDLSGAYRVTNAKVYLSQAHDCEHPLFGFEVETDPDGYYRISLSNLLESNNNRNEYCLVVKKNGYVSFDKDITIGAFNSYMKNTVLLQKQPDFRQELFKNK
jgi:hypothetical protein